MGLDRPWVGPPAESTSAVTTIAVDITGAAVGEWIEVVIGLGDSQALAPTPPGGWTDVVNLGEGTSGGSSSRLWIICHKKAGGETTVSPVWGTACKVLARAFSWPGCDATSPLEGVVSAAHTAGANFAAGPSTPGSTDRWAVEVALSRDTTAPSQSFTADKDLVERADFNNSDLAFAPWMGIQVADSAMPVTQVAHTYTAVRDQGAVGHGATALFFLVQALNVLSGPDLSPLGLLDETLAPLNSGQSYTGPWISTDGIEQVTGQWLSAGGATITAVVEESIDGTNADSSQSLGTPAANGPAVPVVVRVRTPWVRLKVSASVANATTLRAGMKGA